MSNLIPVYCEREFRFFVDQHGDRVWDETAGTRPLPELLHEMADTAETFSKCYFIGGETGPVKIGHSVDPKGRLRTIQNYSPVKLSILALVQGGLEREGAYHFQFQDHRLHGEWFERCPEIEDEIERLNRHAQ